MKKRFAAICALLALSACAAAPDEESITLGVSPGAGALSYLADDGRYVGFHVELCERIVRRYAQATGKRVRIAYRPVTSASGLEGIKSGAIQFECGSTTNTMERQDEVDFLPTAYVLESRLAVPDDSPVRHSADLNGKRIAVIDGSHAQQALRRTLRDEKVTAETVPVHDLDEMIRLLGRHEVEAVLAETGPLVSVLIGRPPTPALKPRFVGPTVFKEPIGIMMSRQPGPLRDLAYQGMVAMMESGEMARLYQAWFESDIPAPLGRLDMPASAATRRAWERPNTQPATPRAQY